MFTLLFPESTVQFNLTAIEVARLLNNYSHIVKGGSLATISFNEFTVLTPFGADWRRLIADAGGPEFA